MSAARVSQDVDLFHDTDEALEASWDLDRRRLEGDGLAVRVLRRRPAFVEAEVSKGDDRVLLQWVRDSAFRFFPLVRHDEFGLTLHAFDLATNKVLALVGRLEVRDWVDVIECSRRIQHLGYLAWAACGKDPGFGPASILDHATRSGRYSAAEVGGLTFLGEPPDAGVLSRTWKAALEEARGIVAVLPPGEVGRAVLDREGRPCRLALPDLQAALHRREVVFHQGRIRGALPQLVGERPR
jgi:hypothetical protein